MAEKIEFELTATAAPAKKTLGEFEDDIEAFNRRLKDGKAIKLSVDVATAKARIQELKEAIKSTDDAGSKLALNAELVRMQTELTASKRALTNYVRTGDETVSVLWKLFGSVTSEIRKSREEMMLLGKDTSKLDVLSKKAEEVKRSFESGKISARQYGKEIGSIKNQLDNAGKSASSVSGVFKSAITAASAYFSAGFIKQLSDDYTTLKNSLKQVATEDEIPGLIERIGKAANESRVPVLTYAQTFQRFDSIMKVLGGSQDQTFTMLDTLSKGMTAAGRSTEETSSVMLQLGQAFGSGKLAGDEFRSVAEAMPGILDILAKSMGVPRGQLKDLASDGKITSEVLMKALIGANDEINKAFDKSSITIPQALTKVQNSLTLAFGKFDETTGFTKNVAGMIESVGKLGESMIGIATKVIPQVSSGFSDLFESAKDAGSKIAEGWGNVADFVSSKTTESNQISILSWEFFGRAIGAVLSVIGQGFRAIVAGLQIVGNVMGRFLSAGIESWTSFGRIIVGIVGIIPESVARAFVALGQLVAGGIAATINKAIPFINGFIDLINKIPGVSVGKLDTIGFAKQFDPKILIPQASLDQFSQAGTKIAESFTTAFDGAGEEISDIFLQMVANGQGAFDKINNLRTKFESDAAGVTASGSGCKAGAFFWDGSADKKKKGAKTQEEKDREKAEKDAKKRREELDKADQDSWDRMRKRREEGYKDLTEANEQNYADVAKLADKYADFGDQIVDTMKKGKEETDKFNTEISDLKNKLDDLTKKKADDLGERFAEVTAEIKSLNAELLQAGGTGKEVELAEKMKKLEEERAFIERNTTEAERKDGTRLNGRSKAEEILDEYNAQKALMELDIVDAENRKKAREEEINQELSNLQIKQDAVALAIANENAMIIQQDEERRKIEADFTKFFGKQIEGRTEMLNGLIERAREARTALAAAGISSSVPSDGSETSGNGKTAYISVTNNSNVDAESFLRNLDNLVK